MLRKKEGDPAQFTSHLHYYLKDDTDFDAETVLGQSVYLVDVKDHAGSVLGWFLLGVWLHPTHLAGAMGKVFAPLGGAMLRNLHFGNIRSEKLVLRLPASFDDKANNFWAE